MKIYKNINLHLSQKRLEMQQKQHYIFEDFKNFKTFHNFLKKLKKLKFALYNIPKKVSERAKQTKFQDHMD